MFQTIEKAALAIPLQERQGTCIGEDKEKRNQPVELKRKEASLQHDVTLSAFKSPKQKGAAAATNMDSRFNLP